MTNLQKRASEISIQTRRFESFVIRPVWFQSETKMFESESM